MNERWIGIQGPLGRVLVAIAAFTMLTPAWEKIKPLPGGYVSTLIAAGGRKLILTAAGMYSRDPGQASWTLLDPPCQSQFDQLLPFGDAVFAYTHTGKPCLSRDGGRTWQAVASGPIKPSPGGTEIVQISYFGIHGLYAVAYDPELVLFRSPDTGRTWKSLPTNFDPASLVDAGPDFLVSSYDGGVHRMDPVTGTLTSASNGLKLDPEAQYSLLGKAPGVILAGTGRVGEGVYRYIRASNRWEMLISDPGQPVVHVAHDGSRVFMFVDSPPDTMRLWRSLDAGATWERQPAYGVTTPHPMWVERDTLFYGDWYRSVVRREWASRSETDWDQGIHAVEPGNIRLHGKVLYVESGSFRGYRRTWDGGTTWEALAESGSARLQITGGQVYLGGKDYLDRIDPTGPGSQRLAFPAMGNGADPLIDAGDRFYAGTSYFPPGPPEIIPLIYSAPKASPLVWGNFLNGPFALPCQFDANGATVAAVHGDTLVYSRDGAKTWTRLTDPPFRTSDAFPNMDFNGYRIEWEGGRWIVWDGIWLYQAADPAGPWSRMPAPVDSIQEYLLAGSRVLVSGQGRFHLSSDGGRAWTALSLPIAPEWRGLALSDSMICVTRSVDTRCQELEPAPVGAAPRESRMPRGRPSWVRRSGRMVIRNPQQSGATTLHGLDGRAVAPPGRWESGP